jgi:hypothetical protein
METPKAIGSPLSKPVMIPQMAGNIPIQLASLMQQVPPAFYANGFEVGITGADVCLTLSLNNRPLATINLSFITAKALGGALSGLVKDLEDKSRTKVPSAEEVARALQMPKA